MAKKLTEEDIIERFKNNKKYKYLEGYTKTHNPAKFQCLECDHIWNIRPNDLFRRNSGCPICANKKRSKNLNQKIENYLENLLIDELNEEYEWLESYNHDNKEKLLIRHKICNYEYKVRPNDFQQGYRCPYCNRSYIETKLSDELKNKNIKFEIERKEYYKNKYFKFDFYLNDFKLYIEIDGEQHFNMKNLYSNKGSIKVQDNLKNNFIHENNLNLLRISYFKRSDSVSIINNVFEVIKGNKDIIKNSSYYYIENGIIYDNDYYRTNYNKFSNDT